MLILQTVLLFFLFTPYLGFKKGLFFSNQATKLPTENRKLSFTEDLLLNSIVIIPLHLLILFWIKDKLEFKVFISLISDDTTLINTFSNSQIGSFIFYFFSYCLFVYAIAFYWGKLSRFIILKYKLDLQYEFYRLFSRWTYTFSRNAPNNADYIVIYIYHKSNTVKPSIIGLLKDFEVTKDDDLKELTLIYARSCKSESTAEEMNLYIDETKKVIKNRSSLINIPGEITIIPFTDILFISISYISISDGS